MSDIKILDFEEHEIVYVEFNMLVDTDYGLIKFIADNFADESMFYTDVLFMDEHLLKGMLMERTNYNPLTVPAIDEDNITLLNTLYDQFIERYYDKILGYSTVTSVLEAVLKYMVISAARIQFICEYESEADVLRMLMNKFGIKDRTLYSIYVRKDTEEIINVSKCNIFIAKHPTSLYRYTGLDTKNIYLADLVCNLDQEKLEKRKLRYPNIDTILYYSENQINYMQLYPYDESYAINGLLWYEDNIEDNSTENNNDNYDEDGYLMFNPRDADMTRSDVNLLKEWMSPDQFNKNFGGNKDE